MGTHTVDRLSSPFPFARCAGCGRRIDCATPCVVAHRSARGGPWWAETWHADCWAENEPRSEIERAWKS